MSDTVIRVENLGKRYIIDHQNETQNYTALRDVIANNAKSLGKRLNLFKPYSSPTSSNFQAKEDFWALKDISFEIKQGDRVGIVGRNGAGKSTLLKILSRITEPTKGRISITGRVASLLEVGTGFHPELTGRENIFLNGAILGMSGAEIRQKFDEIVAFAEVERFLDTPVKRYSSGMYVRLAFSVAAHLEPEVLIVDEVLAVGDAAFQKKCLGKMEDVSKEGRTVLFVSHHMPTITSLCERVVWLMDGQMHMEGNAEYITSKYLTYGAENSGDISLPEKPLDSRFQFKRLTLLDSQDQITSVYDLRKPIVVRLEYNLDQLITNLEISLRVYNSTGVPIFTTNRSSCLSSDIAIGRHVSQIEIPQMFLSPGTYSITVGAHVPNVETCAVHESLMSFDVEETGSEMASYAGAAFGVVLMNCAWKESTFVTI
jgi:lipopolysaccharide transport system ATP-binding protein